MSTAPQRGGGRFLQWSLWSQIDSCLVGDEVRRLPVFAGLENGWATPELETRFLWLLSHAPSTLPAA